ncbi:sulfotransferase [Demequina flava]|uniref:sulfotransferase n=1 Tax=Demequina flava TaxID=1095025 RepID=UPI0007835B7C|nr:sulfotransferase [Demequina flava]
MHQADAQESRKTFLLGLGAQKAGTTWMYSYLQRSPQFAHGYFKEYHVFDCIDVPLQQWNRRKVFRLASEESLKALDGERAEARKIHRASMVLQPKHYFNYFDALSRARDETRLVADVTPDYALLPQSRLENIRDSFAERGLRTAAVFLLRDPVDRTYSQIRMQQGRQPDRFPAPAEQVISTIHTDEIYAARSRYEDTIERLDSVFDPKDLHFEFYETLFTSSAVKRLCDFLGIETIDADFNDKRNVSRPVANGGLDENIVADIAHYLAPTYAAVARRFPKQDLTEIWPSARHVL